MQVQMQSQNKDVGISLETRDQRHRDLIFSGEPEKMKHSSNRSDDLIKYFDNHTSPRYLWTGETWRCHCSHEVSQHRTISKSPFIAFCMGSKGKCPCKEFVPYRNISRENQV
jgi:hypothetical protein